jgi:hypothetical protein
VEAELIDWTEQLALMGFFYPEPEYHPEAAHAASLRAEASDHPYKKFMDELRAKAATAKRV